MERESAAEEMGRSLIVNGRKIKMLCHCLISFMLISVITVSDIHAGETLNYRLKWLFNTSVAGDIYADDRGFFQKEGLDVKVKEGGPERDAIRELELGHAQFGVASADQVIRALSKGAPVVVLVQLFQINPLQWVYRADKDSIEKLSDLKGRVLGITYGGNDETIMRTLLAKGRLKESEVKFFSVRYDFTPFYRGQADIWPVYRNAQGPIIAKKLGENGEDVRFFDPAAFGVKFVANSVVTSERMMAENADTVRKFRKALLKGWEEALAPENAEKTLETLAKFDKDTSPDIRRQQLEITRSLIKPGPDFPIGSIDTAAWKQTEKMMLDQKQIPNAVSVEKVLIPLDSPLLHE